MDFDEIGWIALDRLAVPRTVYCAPEVAAVGLARERGDVATERFVARLAATDRGILDGVSRAVLMTRGV